jgi:2-succinyl-5-enolpyruvyl-6-hydroxy-3-cyclohexene-1-carboxylate synthase
LSADRPAYKLNIGDGQTINQNNVFEKNILYSKTLKQDCTHSTEEIIKSNKQEIIDGKSTASSILSKQKSIQKDNELIIEEAFNNCINNNKPIHLNIPMEEPLYDFVSSPSIKINIRKKLLEPLISENKIAEVYNEIEKEKRILILVGVAENDILSNKSIEIINSLNSMVVLKEHTSNIHNESFISNIDRIIGPIELQQDSHEIFEELSPDVIITMGGMIISKKLKLFLRNFKAKKHFHIGKNSCNDSFYLGVEHLNMRPDNFFENMNIKSQKSNYSVLWNRQNLSKKNLHERFTKIANYSDLKVFDILSEWIPKKYDIQVANSTPIRYFQLFDIRNQNNMFANRGTSGIDGSTSTAIGSSINNNSPVLLVTGDLSFFYDMNALWNNYTKSDFRIIIVNNQGGGIFKILPGHKENDIFSEFIETKHNLSARNISKMFNCNYNRVSTKFGLNIAMRTFFRKSKKPKILEIKTSGIKSAKILKDYFRYLSKS